MNLLGEHLQINKRRVQSPTTRQSEDQPAAKQKRFWPTSMEFLQPVCLSIMQVIFRRACACVCTWVWTKGKAALAYKALIVNKYLEAQGQLIRSWTMRQQLQEIPVSAPRWFRWVFFSFFRNQVATTGLVAFYRDI